MARKGDCKPCQIPEPEIEQILARYAAGEGLYRLVLGMGYSTREYVRLRELLKSRGVTLRAVAEANRARKGCEVDLTQISQEQWRALYWSAESGLPTTAALGARLGVSDETVRVSLHRAGIRVRNRSEQRAIEVRMGRQPPPKGNPNGVPIHCRHVHRRHSPEVIARVAAANRRRETVPCSWCGNPVTRIPSQLNPRWNYCSLSCAAYHHHHLHRLGPEAPRPRLVERLRSELGGSPATAERLERLAEPLGAGWPEILAVVTTMLGTEQPK